jgi:hypothetical protein
MLKQPIRESRRLVEHIPIPKWLDSSKISDRTESFPLKAVYKAYKEYERVVTPRP